MRIKDIILILSSLLLQLYLTEGASLDKIEPGYENVFPITTGKLLGCALLMVLMCFSVVGGLGGGSICVYMLLLFFKLDVVHAAAISNTVITFSALVQYFGFYACQKHPSRNAPITDYNIAVLVLPMTLLGTKCGILAYRIFAPSFLLLFVAIIITFFAVLTFINGVKLLQEYNKAQPLPASEREIPQADIRDTSAQSNAEMIQYGIVAQEVALDATAPMWPIGKLLYSGLMMCIILIADLMHGSRYTPSIFAFTICGAPYFIVFGVIVVGSIIFTTISYLMVRQDPASVNLKLDTLNMIKIILIGFLSGFLLASSGLGGGMVLNPLLLQIGVDPEVTAATTIFVLGITTFVSSLLLTMHGYMLLGYFILFNILAGISTVGARLCANRCCKDRFISKLSILISVGVVLSITVIVVPFVVFTRGTTLSMIFTFRTPCTA